MSWKDDFILNYTKTGNLYQSAVNVGKSYQTVFIHRKRDSEFAAALDEIRDKNKAKVPDWIDPFFEELEKTGSMNRSAAIAGISATTVAHKKIKDTNFRDRVEKAIAIAKANKLEK